MSAAAKATMRRGACPALSAPMQTGDGLLVRLNLAEGGMTPGELGSGRHPALGGAALEALGEALPIHE